MSDSLDAVVLPLIEALAEEWWCVVLKKLPKYLGWYFGEISGGRQLEGTWCCEASWADHDKGAVEAHAVCVQADGAGGRQRGR